MVGINRLVGFDFGTKKIGTAFGQMITKTATPLHTLANIHGHPDWAAIANLIETWKPQALVVGLPLNMDDTSQNVTLMAEDFSKALEKKFKLPCFLVDERLSTVSARSSVFEKGGYKALKKTSIDSVAAKIILESWMAAN